MEMQMDKFGRGMRMTTERKTPYSRVGKGEFHP
jgi:hypothetical protein